MSEKEIKQLLQKYLQYVKQLPEYSLRLGKQLLQSDFYRNLASKRAQYVKQLPEYSLRLGKQLLQPDFDRNLSSKRAWKRASSLLFILLVILSVVVVGTLGTGAGIVTAMVKSQPVLSRAQLQQQLNGLFQNSYAYFADKDKNGQNIAIGAFNTKGDERQLIHSTHDVTPYLTNAFLSIEDHDFYNHSGIVPSSILRAVYQQVTQADVTTGGSTLTQQLVKNVILKDYSKHLERKAKEIVLALRVDSLFSKEEIFVDYMNSVYFGNSVNGSRMYGVEAAAYGMFDVDAKDLKLPQAAYIAGMVQRPNALNPFSKDPNNIKRGLARMKLVLSKMLENGKITQQEYNEAIAFDIKGSLAKPGQIVKSYQKYHFILDPLQKEAALDLMQSDGINVDKLSKADLSSALQDYEFKVSHNGYRVYTTVDQKIYDAINQAAMNNITFHYNTYIDPDTGKETSGHEELGAMMMDNRTGGIIGFVVNVNQGNKVDHVFSTLTGRRQPGSSIKPLLDYGPALDNHIITPNTIILDDVLPKRDHSGVYKNANNKYSGPVSAIEALKWSKNLPALRIYDYMYYHMGQDLGFSYLEKMGLYPDKRDDGVESLAIGGFTYGFTVKNMTAAYSTFANNGTYLKPYMVTKIVDATGKVVYTHQSQPTQVFKAQTTYQMTKMLRQVVNGGTAAYVGSHVRGYDLAGKTGTTTSERDKWFIGYTPQITLGAWGGYDANFKMKNEMFTQQAWVNIFNAAAAADPTYFNKSLNFSNPGGYLGGPIAYLNPQEIANYYAKNCLTPPPGLPAPTVTPLDPNAPSDPNNPFPPTCVKPGGGMGNGNGGNDGTGGNNGGGNGTGGNTGQWLLPPELPYKP